MSGRDYSQVSKEKLLEVCSRRLDTHDGRWFNIAIVDDTWIVDKITNKGEQNGR